jgi:hypothetical protein
MSTSVVSAGPRRPRPGLAPWGLLALAALAGCDPARAQEGQGGALAEEPEEGPSSPVDILTGGMQAYVDALAAEPRRWEGQRVPWPAARARRPSLPAAESPRWGAAVHLPETLPDAELAARWAEALDRAHAALAADGWPLPPPDGGLGGGDGLDVYLVDALDEGREPDGLEPEPGDLTRAPRRSETWLDVPLFPAALDGAVVHAEVSADVPRDRVLACAVQVVAEAGLFAADPAEAASLRHATGAWLAWAYTGSAGCDEDALGRQQRASARRLVGPEARDAEGGAILLAAVAQRHDAHGTEFLRDVWQLARQRTRDDGDLRGEPDVLRVLGQAADLAHDPLDRVVESLAVARWLAGERASRDDCDVALLRTLPEDARVPVLGTSAWERLPRSLRLEGAPLEPWGSAYVRVDVGAAPAGSVLRVWLDGETGTEWSLVAVRLGGDGRERGRTRAPRTRRTRSYVPVELGEGTAEVLLVVTSIPDDDDPRDAHVPTSSESGVRGRLFRPGLDADAPGPSGRAFRLLLDRGP